MGANRIGDRQHFAATLTAGAAIISGAALLYTTQRNQPAHQPQPAPQPIVIHLTQPGHIPPAMK